MRMYSPVLVDRGYVASKITRGSLGPLDLDVPLFCNAFPRRCFISKESAIVSPKLENKRQSDVFPLDSGHCLPSRDVEEVDGATEAGAILEDQTRLTTLAERSPDTGPGRQLPLVHSRTPPPVDRRSSLTGDGKLPRTGVRRQSLNGDRRQSLNFDRRQSLNVERKEFPHGDRRHSVTTGRRASLNYDRLPAIGAAGTDRRLSLKTDRQYSGNNDRVSLASDRRASLVPLSTRRSSLTSERQTSPVLPAQARKFSLQTDTTERGLAPAKQTPGRRWSVIAAPKKIHEYNMTKMAMAGNTADKQINTAGYDASKENRHWITKPTLPLGSDADTSGACSNDDSWAVASPEETDRSADMTVHYRPKPCWCLRCQIMQWMFNTNDERLALWGNYPCFRGQHAASNKQ